MLSAKTKQPMRITDTPEIAFEKVQMDIVGPLPITKKGNRYLLTLQDNLTKYSDAIPLATIDSITVALALAEQFVSRFGCPRVIHTDQGSNFVSAIMKNFSVHEATNFTPHELVFGRKATFPSEFAKQEVPRTFIQYLDQLLTTITTTQATAAANLVID